MLIPVQQHQTWNCPLIANQLSPMSFTPNPRFKKIIIISSVILLHYLSKTHRFLKLLKYCILWKSPCLSRLTIQQTSKVLPISLQLLHQRLKKPSTNQRPWVSSGNSHHCSNNIISRSSNKISKNYLNRKQLITLLLKLLSVLTSMLMEETERAQRSHLLLKRSGRVILRLQAH